MISFFLLKVIILNTRGLAKSYHQEKRLNALEKKIENISPEDFDKFRNSD